MLEQPQTLERGRNTSITKVRYVISMCATMYDENYKIVYNIDRSTEINR